MAVSVLLLRAAPVLSDLRDPPDKNTSPLSLYQGHTTHSVQPDKETFIQVYRCFQGITAQVRKQRAWSTLPRDLWPAGHWPFGISSQHLSSWPLSLALWLQPPCFLPGISSHILASFRRKAHPNVLSLGSPKAHENNSYSLRWAISVPCWLNVLFWRGWGWVPGGEPPWTYPAGPDSPFHPGGSIVSHMKHWQMLWDQLFFHGVSDFEEYSRLPSPALAPVEGVWCFLEQTLAVVACLSYLSLPYISVTCLQRWPLRPQVPAQHPDTLLPGLSSPYYLIFSCFLCAYSFLSPPRAPLPLLFSFLFKIFINFFGRCTICRTLVPWPVSEPVPPAVESQIVNHWTTIEAPKNFYLKILSCFPPQTVTTLLISYTPI